MRRMCLVTHHLIIWTCCMVIGIFINTLSTSARSSVKRKMMFFLFVLLWQQIRYNMMRGICHWFYRVNENDCHGVRMCRDGSLCRYKHLTQDEVFQLQHHGHEKMGCKTCNGRKVQTMNWTFNGKETPTNITCMTCNGHGEMPVRQIILDKAANRLWCRCGGDRDTQYFPDNTHPYCRKHCYVCMRCKGITQTG